MISLNTKFSRSFQVFFYQLWKVFDPETPHMQKKQTNTHPGTQAEGKSTWCAHNVASPVLQITFTRGQILPCKQQLTFQITLCWFCKPVLICFPNIVTWRCVYFLYLLLILDILIQNILQMCHCLVLFQSGHRTTSKQKHKLKQYPSVGSPWGRVLRKI